MSKTKSIITITLIMIIIGGCTSQKEYDALVKENETLKKEVSDLYYESFTEYANHYLDLLESDYQYCCDIGTLVTAGGADWGDIQKDIDYMYRNATKEIETSVKACESLYSNGEWGEHSGEYSKSTIKKEYDEFEAYVKQYKDAVSKIRK